MSDIFREVDEALQREKAEKFWKEYGPTVLLAAILLVVGTAAGVAWRTWDHNRNETETAKLVEALDGQEVSIDQLKSIIGESRDGPEAIALMTAAEALQQKDDRAGAAALYRQAAESRGTPKDLRDLSRILFVRTTQDSSADQKMAVLKPVLDNTQSPFIWHARIEAALVSASAEKFQEAVNHLTAFKDQQDTLPPSLLDRASALRQLYTLKAQEKAAQ